MLDPRLAGKRVQGTAVEIQEVILTHDISTWILNDPYGGCTCINRQVARTIGCPGWESLGLKEQRSSEGKPIPGPVMNAQG